MNNTVTVRAATLRDTPTLVQFNSAMATESEAKGLNAAVLNSGIRHLLQHPADGFYLVAELAGDTSATVVGALMVTYEWSDWRDGRFWWIQSVYVSPEHRRKGVYSALHAAVREQATRDPQACGIRLYVERDNHGAQATYAHLGMLETAYRLYEEEF